MNNIPPGVSTILVWKLFILFSLFRLFFLGYYVSIEKKLFSLSLVCERFNVYFIFSSMLKVWSAAFPADVCDLADPF